MTIANWSQAKLAKGIRLKLIIQIPCLNEGPRIAGLLSQLPRHIPGVSSVEFLVIDDGSTDGTADIARSAGVHHVVQFPHNRGLSVAFQSGLSAALRAGADIIVNTDADNQYNSACIPDLLLPILSGEADIVVGDRRPHRNPEFSWAKRRLQRIGSKIVQLAGAPGAVDATSGFRAYTREAALNLVIVNRYTYTIESTIQAGLSPLRMVWVPVKTNPQVRESRLVKSTFSYVRKNAFTILRVFATYRPLRFFGSLAFVLALGAGAAFSPFLRSWIIEGDRGGNLQSIVLGAILSISSVLMFAIGFLGDLIRTNREMIYQTLVATRRMSARNGGE